MQKPTVVFFGSGPVAAKALELAVEHLQVVAVVTKPKPAHHKGDFPVITLSEKLGLPIYTVSTKSELSALIANKPFKTDLALLIDFGIIVTQDVIDYFPRGIINSHFSLLPEWRGADPITFAILSGQERTGVSLMVLVEAMDEGPIISVGIQDISGTETTPSLTEKLIYLSDALLKEQIPRYLVDGKGINQSELSTTIPGYPAEPTYSRKLTKADGILVLTKPAKVLEREIRAFLEWPKSHTKLADIDVIITSAKVTNDSGEPGTISIQDKRLLLHCGEGSLEIQRLKPAGKNEMLASAFLAGYSEKLKSTD